MSDKREFIEYIMAPNGMKHYILGGGWDRERE